MEISTVVSVASAIVAVIVTLSNLFIRRRESEFEILRGVIDELRKWKEEAEAQLKKLEDWKCKAQARIANLEAEVSQWKTYAMNLYNWGCSHGLSPPKLEDVIHDR